MGQLQTPCFVQRCNPRTRWVRGEFRLPQARGDCHQPCETTRYPRTRWVRGEVRLPQASGDCHKPRETTRYPHTRRPDRRRGYRVALGSVLQIGHVRVLCLERVGGDIGFCNGQCKQHCTFIAEMTGHASIHKADTRGRNGRSCKTCTFACLHQKKPRAGFESPFLSFAVSFSNCCIFWGDKYPAPTEMFSIYF